MTNPERDRPMHKRAGFYAFLPPALLAGGLIVSGVVRASGRDGNGATAVAHKQLAKDLEKTPFVVQLPRTLPRNAQLIRTFLDEPDVSKGYQAYAINTWYAVPDPKGPGKTIHVWQTNDNFLARKLQDPLERKGDEEQVAGAGWNRVEDTRVRGHKVIVFSRRLDDGTTMAVDAQDPSDIRATIEALAPANSPANILVTKTQ